MRNVEKEILTPIQPRLRARPVLEVRAEGRLVERKFLGILRLQVIEWDNVIQAQLCEHLGTLPEASAFVEHHGLRIHWISPKEYLVILEEGGDEQCVIDLLADLPVLISVISDSRITFSLKGEVVPKILAQRCGLDLHPSVFVVGCSTVTRVAGLSVMVVRVDSLVYEVSMDRSYGQYFWEWFEQGFSCFEMS